MKNVCRCLAWVVLALLAGGLTAVTANAAVTVLGVQYQPDKLHPEFDCTWNSSGFPGNCASNFAGANVHVYLRNDGASNVNVTNLTIAGYELVSIVKLRNQGQNDPYSIYYYWDDPPQAIFDAGEPVWFRHDPTNIPPGAVFQAVVRLRLIPVTQPVSFGVMTDAGTVTTNITVDANAPQLASVGFSPDLDKVYLHWRRSDGAIPTTIIKDGVDVTSLTTTVGDPNYNFAVSVISLTNPMGYMGYHVFQGVYADGKIASASLRAWVNKFNIGTYGMPPTTTWDDARAMIDDYENRGVNFTVYNLGSDGIVDFINKPEGQTYCDEHGFEFMPENPSQWNTVDPLGWYLRDEPDAHDWHLTRDDTDTPPLLYLPQNNQHSVGILAIPEILRGDSLHYAQGGITPTVVNVDATYMPYNYYTYGQMADIGMTDPYYTSRQSTAFWYNTNSIPLYVKPYPYIYAVSQAMTEGSEPSPSLVAMSSVGDYTTNSPDWWPYPTPECKRMENYYAVAAGAKNLGYWWMLGGFGQGIVTNAPAARDLWKGIGLCGNEFRTAQPLIVISHPAALPLTPSTNLWARALLAGMDAILLFVMNDYYTNDIAGFHYSPISNATVTVTLPSWFNSSATTFEVVEQAEGIKDVSAALTNGNQLQINLGTVNLTRLIVVTTNLQWRATLQQRYLEKAYQGVCAFAPEHCESQATCILNADAEGGFRNRGGGVIANNWFEFEGADGTNIVCYDETTIKHGGSHSQRIRAWKSGTVGTSGGVYQRIPTFVGTNYTVSVWMSAGDSGSFCYLGVDRNGGTDPAAGTVSWSTAHNATNWTQKTWNGNASNNFITVFYKVGSTNGNKRNGYFDDATPACTAPTITQHPVGYTNCPGATTNFTVAASAVGAISYQWQRSGINLTDAGHYSGVTTATLTVSGMDNNDSGDYRCAVTTSYGQIYSSAATLAVRQATTFTLQPVAHDVCSGGNTTFTVAAIGDGTVTYQWQKNLTNINNGGHYSGCTTATLTITGADSSDVANYRCVATAGCGNSTSFQGALSLATAVPSITGNQTSKDICPGGTVNFSVTATGSGILTYQWQKNGSNLSNGGHYSNVTTATLTVTGADAGDAASYRCVVSNGCGGSTSSAATLTLGATPTLLNSSFELGNTGGVATNWTSYQRSPNPTTVWTIQTSAPPVGAGVQYQQLANTSSTGGGGVRQDITGCTVGATYSVAGWYRGNSGIYSICRVKVSPTASTSWATAIDLSPAQSYTGATWTNFGGTVVATATTMTLWLDGSTSGTGQNKAECFDGVTVTCVGGVQKPDITGQPSAQNVCPGVNVSFVVTATGGGTITYQWQTNGVDLGNSSHYGGATAATLWVTNVASADAVNYRCVVSNEGGSTNSSTAALTVKAATSITQQPSGQNVCPGTTTGFSVAATGDGTVTYQWQTNGVNISNNSHYAGCTATTLWVTNAQSADAVNYRCVATAGCGSANSSDAALTLKAVTTITGQPSAQNLCPGANATFTVSATGDGALTYQWQTNGVNLSNGSHYSGCTSATLWVTNSGSADTVNYRCVVTGGCGSANSSDAALTLKAVTSITGQPSAQNVCPGTTATFSVSATGDGALTYQWQTNGVNISNGSHYAGCTAATLWVTNSGSADTVNYHCVVTGGCGNATSSDAALTLKAVTSITGQPSAQNVCPGANANFSVTATGEGALTYQWQTNGVNLSDGAHYSGCTTASLTVNSAGSADAVNYRCVVTGGCGSANSSTAALTLKAVTSITGQPSAQNVCPGANATFSVTATGDGALTYQWQTNGVNISNGSHYAGCTAATLWVTNSGSADTVNYRCVVTGGCGSATSSTAALTLKTATSITQQPAAQNICAGVTTNFTVAATGDGTLMYQWQTNGVNISNNSHYSGCTAATLWVTNAGSADAVNYHCVVTGGCGSATSSDAALTLRAVTTITQQPSAQNVCPGVTATFSVVATGDGTLTYQWQTNSVNLSNGSHYAGCTTATLWVTNSGSADTVNYRCVVTAGCGSATSSTAALTLKAVTTITQQPTAKNICPGVTTNFTVAATGDGTLTYQWQTNSVNISNGSHYSGCTAATLWVTNATSADAVNYRCVVTAGCGSANSSTAAMTVKAATTITQQPVARNICTGVTTNFVVAATGDGTLTYQWQTNGVNLSNNSHYSGCTAATLWVTNAQSADQVNYRCVATAGCGSANSSDAALTLKAVTTITQQPVNRQVPTGGTTNFTVAATGDGTLTYQWQTNSVNISNNSHYSGCTSATLWITNCTSADARNYRCVVTGGCGSATSSNATLTVCAATLLNASFELSNISGVATNWTGYQRSPNPTTVWTIQTASPPAGSGTNYQQIANTTSTGGGGVRQDIKNCVIGATYTVAGWFRGNSASYATCTVKVSPTASTNWATATNLNPVATMTGASWTNFSGTVVATGTNMTLWLDGQTGGTGQNKAECFDAVTVTCGP